jgi:hypothetical protein
MGSIQLINAGTIYDANGNFKRIKTDIIPAGTKGAKIIAGHKALTPAQEAKARETLQKKVLINKVKEEEAQRQASTASVDTTNPTAKKDSNSIEKTGNNISFPAKILNSQRKITFNVWEKEVGTIGDTQKAFNTAVDSFNKNANKISDSAGLSPNDKITWKTAENQSTKLYGSITLPLPNILRDSQGHDWSVESSVLGTMAGSITSKNIGSLITEAGGQVGQFVGGVVGSSLIDKGISAITNAVGNAASSVSIDQTLGSLSASSGTRKTMADPGYFQNYKGSRPRNFSMSWELIPKSIEESQRIYNIISSFKYHSSPSTDIRGVTLLAPRFFTLDISNKWLENMILPGHVVITEVNVDYGSDGNMTLHEVDGFPKAITLTISFADLKMRYSQDYKSVSK